MVRNGAEPMTTTLVEELEQVGNYLAGRWPALADRIRARAVRVREVGVSIDHDVGLSGAQVFDGLTGPDLGPTRRDGGA
jgi:hypothetical protein